jgi:hypothetical protein
VNSPKDGPFVKLGIVVVYYIKDENEALLKLHLAQIEKHTTVPYTIYASVNRLESRFLPILAGRKDLKICDCPTTELRSDNEQIYYLEHLIGEAIKDDATHIATLHVDSFPLRSDWVQTLADRLSDTCVFAVPYYGNYTSCLFFEAAFYRKHRPKFVLTHEEYSSKEYQRFCKRFAHIPHAGVGFFWKAYRENLIWFPLTESKKRSTRYVFHSNIYNDIIFHLNAAAWSENVPVDNMRCMDLRKWLFSYFWASIFRFILLTKIQQRALGLKRLIIPRKIISWGWRHIGNPFFYKPVNRHERDRLLEDPEAYLKSLQT